MRLRSLKHMAMAALHLTRSERIIVVGSASLMATFGEMGEPGQLLENTLDADLVLDPDDQELVNLVHDAMGPKEPFYDRFGYHVDVLRAEFGDSLPPGWKDRLVPLADCPGVVCLEPHDLAVAKLFACLLAEGSDGALGAAGDGAAGGGDGAGTPAADTDAGGADCPHARRGWLGRSGWRWRVQKRVKFSQISFDALGASGYNTRRSP